MNITWLGHSCFLLEEKMDTGNVSVVIDPYQNEIGLRLPKTRADIVTLSHDHEGHNNSAAIISTNNESSPAVFDRPGEYEVKGVFMMGIGSYHDNKEGEEYGKSTMFKFDFNGLTVLHLGDLGSMLSDVQMDKIEDVDVLLVPIGGKTTIDAKQAMEIVKELEPRVVIPMHYALPGLKNKYDDLEKFKKEAGKFEVVPKLKFSKKDLPEDQTKIYILEN